MKKWIFGVLVAIVLSVIIQAPQTLSAAQKIKPVKVRVGHFSNITHAQALILHSTGKLQDAFKEKAVVEWKVFNAGPSAVEAMFAGNLDIAVIGPSPAINAFVKSDGEAVRVVAGSASGGAALVTRGDLDIRNVEDFQNKKIASPQLGNTQDVALRSWLRGSGLKLKEKGGDVQVLPLSNADQQTLFIKKEIDAAWTVEPWVSLLIEKANAKVFLEESDLWAGGKYSTSLVLVRRKFLDEHPELVKRFLEVHVDLTRWVQSNPVEAKKIIREEIKKESGKELPDKILDSAFSRILFTYEPLTTSILEQAKAAYQAGFLKKEPDLGGLFDLSLLEEVLKERGLEAVAPELEAETQK
jgi:NitT/TauT family transport system substrate-binding protein